MKKVFPAWKEILSDLRFTISLMPRDVVTHWNSTFDLLEYALKHHKAVELLTQRRELGLRKFELADDEWVIVGQLIFCVLGSNTYAAYVQCFAVVPRSGPNNTCTMTGMHALKHATWANGEQVGKVIPLTHIRSPAHLILQFGREAHPRLTKSNCYEFSNDFWLNKY